MNYRSKTIPSNSTNIVSCQRRKSVLLIRCHRISFNGFVKISATFDHNKLANQLQLSLLKQLKQSLEKSQMDNNNINKDQEKQMKMIEYHEHKSNKYNLIVTVTHGIILGDGDNLTAVGGATDFTGVLSIAAPLLIVNPLIVLINRCW